MDPEHDLAIFSLIENACLSAAELICSNAIAREESALDSYDSLRDR
jgi:hypothetical protein